MLEVRGLSAGYGGAPVVQNVDLTVAAGEIVTLVGANGAGKSTLVKAISGLIRPHAGQILFEGKRVEALPPSDRVLAGITHVPEGRQVFGGMSVAENLQLGAYANRKHLGEAEIKRRMHEVCNRFPVLEQKIHDLAANLSGGQQQMLAIARGLMAGPRLLLLDEPSLGLAPLLVSEIFHLIATLREQGVAILLAEQNARLALLIADRGYVIENGRVALTGAARDLLASSDIAQRYLGGGAKAAAVGGADAHRLTARLTELLTSGPAVKHGLARNQQN